MTTEDPAATAFAQILHGDPEPPEPEPGPRVPAPNYAQGKSAQPAPVDPAVLFSEAMQRWASRQSYGGGGAWHDLTNQQPY